MRIYIDLVLILNFCFDFILLLSVSVLLKRRTKLYRIIISAFFGSLSILLLFLNITSLELFFIKIILSIIMILIAFGYQNINYSLKNTIFLYINSIVLGGILYFLNITFAYKNNGLAFYFNGLSINFIFLIIFSPILIYIYIHQLRSLKNNYNNYYPTKIYFNNQVITINGFLDTGNKLVDPYFKYPVILLNKKKILFDINPFKMVLIPYTSISNNGLLKCIKATKVELDDKIIKNVYIGLIENIYIDDVDLILNTKLWEKI